MRTAQHLPRGFKDEANRVAFLAGRSNAPRCTSLAKHGGRCGVAALRGTQHCLMHASPAVRRERRLARLAAPKTAAQAERNRMREHARVQRVIWRKYRWAEGATVTLGPREAAFQCDLAALGFQAWHLSPATLDAARWTWLQVQEGRRTMGEAQARLRLHVAKDNASPEPN